MASKDDEADHMRWQVEKRSQNQDCCLKLFELLDRHPKIWLQDDYFFASQTMIGVAFSLWRAVFLAKKEGTRKAVFDHSKAFFEAVILDNSISYPQDKRSNEWTFNYYVNNARYRLVELKARWPKMVPTLEYPNRTAKKRWTYSQSVLSKAVSNFERHLDRI